MQTDFKVVPILYMGEALEIWIRERLYLFSPVPKAACEKFMFMLSKNKGRAIEWLEKRVGKGTLVGERRGDTDREAGHDGGNIRKGVGDV